jgi:Fe-S-cluster containining protein
MNPSYREDRRLTTASATLNPVLSAWIDVAPGGEETAALDCAGCARRGKCCDFQPFVAGFLLGAILEEGGGLPAPSASFHYQPLGMIASAEFRRRHARTPEAERGADLHCVFYDDAHGRCSIWSRRPGECSTYLCTPATEGRARLSARAFAVETAVSQMALAMQGYSAAQIRAQVDFLNSPPDDGLPEGNGARGTDGMFALYRRTWHWARNLGRGDIAALMEGT